MSGTALAAGVSLCLTHKSPVASAIPLTKSTPREFTPVANGNTDCLSITKGSLKHLFVLILINTNRQPGN